MNLPNPRQVLGFLSPLPIPLKDFDGPNRTHGSYRKKVLRLDFCYLKRHKYDLCNVLFSAVSVDLIEINFKTIVKTNFEDFAKVTL